MGWIKLSKHIYTIRVSYIDCKFGRTKLNETTTTTATKTVFARSIYLSIYSVTCIMIIIIIKKNDLKIEFTKCLSIFFFIMSKGLTISWSLSFRVVFLRFTRYRQNHSYFLVRKKNEWISEYLNSHWSKLNGKIIFIFIRLMDKQVQRYFILSDNKCHKQTMIYDNFIYEKI